LLYNVHTHFAHMVQSQNPKRDRTERSKGKKSHDDDDGILGERQSMKRERDHRSYGSNGRNRQEERDRVSV